MFKIWNDTEWVEVKELSEKYIGTISENYPKGTVILRMTVGGEHHYMSLNTVDARKMANKILEQCGE